MQKTLKSVLTHACQCVMLVRQARADGTCSSRFALAGIQVAGTHSSPRSRYRSRRQRPRRRSAKQRTCSDGEGRESKAGHWRRTHRCYAQVRCQTTRWVTDEHRLKPAQGRGREFSCSTQGFWSNLIGATHDRSLALPLAKPFLGTLHQGRAVY